MTKPCVKTVNYLFNQNITTGGLLFTNNLFNKKLSTSWVQKLIIQQLNKLFNNQFYTSNFHQFNLLNKLFTHYPHNLLITNKMEK